MTDTTTTTPDAGFLVEPGRTGAVAQMYDAEQERQGYVANLTRVWAQSPEALAVLSHALGAAHALAGVGDAERALLTTATASTMGDAYCSLVWGTKLARSVGEEVAAGLIRGEDELLGERGLALAAWARQLVHDPSGTTLDDVDHLRALGYSDQQVFGLTLFVALRQAFSTVNDALGALPDAHLVVPDAVREAIDFGRRSPT
jgi:alkylhydroperoxidase family enzyme